MYSPPTRIPTTGRLRNAVIGHTVGICSALACLAAFGLWNAPSSVVLGHSSWAQAGASALAMALTLFFLQVLRAHYAPAAASALLITTGLARPGLPLAGLVVGLVILMSLAPVLASFPLASHDID